MFTRQYMKSLFRISMCLFILIGQVQSQSTISLVTVFQAGESGYKCFRIPEVVCSPSGKLFAFAEARTMGCGDFGDVDIVLKTSANGGKSWGPLIVVATNDSLQSGNPAPVFDLHDPDFPNGRLLLFYNNGNASENEVRQGKGQREVWYTASKDEGETWEKPTNITSQTHRPLPDTADWRSYANTPGHAIQLPSGLIFIPANHSAGPPQAGFKDYQSHAFFTNDNCKSFELASNFGYPGSNECMAVDLPGGGLLMSARDQSGLAKHRLLGLSSSHGIVWDSIWVATDLPDPVCQGSILSFKQKNGRDIILHCNPDSQVDRCCLSIKKSIDQGANWQMLLKVYEGSAAYSDLVKVDAEWVGVLFEADNYQFIKFGTFKL
jgi:sialidase-1